MQDFVLTLWAAYVVLLIVTKLPDFLRSAARLVGGLQRAWGVSRSGSVDLKTKVATGIVAAVIGLVAAWKGRSLVAYVDPVGIPTICDGYTHGVKLGDVVAPERCDALTEQEVRKSLAVVDRSVSQTLPDGVRVALASFVYNVGPGAYGSSTLLRKLRAGDLAGACNQLPSWVYAGARSCAVLNGGAKQRGKYVYPICSNGGCCTGNPFY